MRSSRSISRATKACERTPSVCAVRKNCAAAPWPIPRTAASSTFPTGRSVSTVGITATNSSAASTRYHAETAASRRATDAGARFIDFPASPSAANCPPPGVDLIRMFTVRSAYSPGQERNPRCSMPVNNVPTRSLGLAMGELARTLQRDHASAHNTLHAVTTAAVQAVPRAGNATISLVRGRTIVQAKAATDAGAHRLDELQAALGDGPCLTAVWEQETVHIPDMATEDRWPRFAAAATEAGVGAMLCLPTVRPRRQPRSPEPLRPTAHAFTDESESIGLVFAAHAAVALAAAQHEQHLHTALAHRDLIGQAKGIVMERFHLDADQAFALLARLSQEEHTKLRDVAARIVAEASTPPTV